LGRDQPAVAGEQPRDAPGGASDPASFGRPTGRFPRTQRVRKRTEFLEIQQNGRRVATPRLVLLLRAREGAPTGARLGVTVSRKVGVAVTRNRAKRVVREAFRATRELWATDCDLVVIVRHVRPAPGLADVVAELRQAERAIRRRTVEARRDREARRERLARGP